MSSVEAAESRPKWLVGSMRQRLSRGNERERSWCSKSSRDQASSRCTPPPEPLRPLPQPQFQNPFAASQMRHQRFDVHMWARPYSCEAARGLVVPAGPPYAGFLSRIVLPGWSMVRSRSRQLQHCICLDSSVWKPHKWLLAVRSSLQTLHPARERDSRHHHICMPARHCGSRLRNPRQKFCKH